MVHLYINVEKANSKIKRKPNNMQVSAFISDCRKELLKNHSVFVYNEYQLEELKLEFGDNLICKYNHENKYWTCKLNISKKSRQDITKEKVNYLYNKGYTLKQISEQLNCSISLIHNRLYKE